MLFKKISFFITLLVFSSLTNATSIPNAGGQLQQIPESPMPGVGIPEITFKQGQGAATPVEDQTKIIVKSLNILGNQVYLESQLIEATGFSSEREMTLGELRSMAASIVDYYHGNGYFVAKAYLPPQEIEDGVVTITVLEGRYDQITLRNESNLSDALANGLVDKLYSGDVISIAPLENILLRLSDLPGVKVKSTLIPGVSVGSSDLIIDIAQGPRLTGSINADNHGSLYTGSNRLGATLNVNEVFGQGDVTTLQLLTSAPGLNYGRASHQMQFGEVMAGIAYARMGYKLGEGFQSLQANGNAKIASTYASYALNRQRKSNLYIKFNYDDKSFQDNINSTNTITNKGAQILSISINGDHSNIFGGVGASNYSFTWTTGHINILSPDALTADTLAAKSNGYYDKFGYSFTHLQRLTANTSFYAAVSGQVSSKNLDTSEKMGLGGANAVRAYPAGEAYGDQGVLLNLELRKQLPGAFENAPGQIQLIGFVDMGAVELNKLPWDEGQNRRALSGVGVGLDWLVSDQFSVKAYLSHKLGSTLATSAPDKAKRFWIESVKYF